MADIFSQLFNKPKSVQRAVRDPGDVPVRGRFFNDTGDIADLEAYSSENGMDYDPHIQLPAVTPYSVREDVQIASTPRYVTVAIAHNGAPIGPFTSGPAAADIDTFTCWLRMNPNGGLIVELVLLDINGDSVGPQIYGA